MSYNFFVDLDKFAEGVVGFVNRWFPLLLPCSKLSTLSSLISEFSVGLCMCQDACRCKVFSCVWFKSCLLRNIAMVLT